MSVAVIIITVVFLVALLASYIEAQLHPEMRAPGAFLRVACLLSGAVSVSWTAWFIVWLRTR